MGYLSQRLCVPHENTCDGLVVIEKHVAHTEILKELQSYGKGMCPLLRKGVRDSSILRYFHMVDVAVGY